MPESWYRLPFVYRPRAERRESPALAAFHWEGSTPKQNHVLNISNSGAYLLTREPWKAGEIVALTLQRSGILESSVHRRVTVQAKTVRCDDQGVAVSFLSPRESDVRLWRSTIKSGAVQTEPEDVVSEFRLAAALGFIRHAAPEVIDAATFLLRRGLSNHRQEGAVEITLHAEELLALGGREAKTLLDPAVLMQILEDGSWSEVDWIRHWWAGLLATSRVDRDETKLQLSYVALLSQITPTQARILGGACRLAAKSRGEFSKKPQRPINCSARDLIKIAETYDRVRIERDILHLVDLGLIEKSVKWRFFSLLDQANVTPTKLATEFYDRCHGLRGDNSGSRTDRSMVASTFAGD